MNKAEIEDLSIAGVNINAENIDEQLVKEGYKENGIHINFKGRIDMENPTEDLMPYLEKVYKKIMSANLRTILIDILGLEYINSAGIRTILMWFNKFSEIPEEQKDEFDITIRYKKGSSWQETILPTFRHFAPDIINIIGV